jgi:methylase of polypeptide subunit release factors
LPLADYATGRSAIALPQFDAWLQVATTSAEQYHFFHWELEFPEVFFDRSGQHKGTAAGFDVVIGNPPYVRQEELVGQPAIE